MQIKITVRHHFTLIKMTVIKKMDNNFLRIWRSWTPHMEWHEDGLLICSGMKIVLPFWKTAWKFLKSQCYHIWPSNYTLRHILKKDESVCPHKKLYTNVHSNIIHNSQEVGKKTKCPSSIKYDTPIHWNTLQPYKEIKYW